MDAPTAFWENQKGKKEKGTRSVFFGKTVVNPLAGFLFIAFISNHEKRIPGRTGAPNTLLCLNAILDWDCFGLEVCREYAIEPLRPVGWCRCKYQGSRSGGYVRPELDAPVTAVGQLDGLSELLERDDLSADGFGKIIFRQPCNAVRKPSYHRCLHSKRMINDMSDYGLRTGVRKGRHRFPVGACS